MRHVDIEAQNLRRNGRQEPFGSRGQDLVSSRIEVTKDDALIIGQEDLPCSVSI
jgi:hypothetical protein